MSGRLIWFMAGMLVAGALVAGGLIAMQQLSDEATAQGTWQVKVLEPYRPNIPPTPGSALTPDPDTFVDDWVVTLPDNCDIVISHDPNVYFYRCP